MLFWPGDLDGDISVFAASWTTNGCCEKTMRNYVGHLRKYQATFPGQPITLANARAIVASESARYKTVGRYMGRALKAFDAAGA